MRRRLAEFSLLPQDGAQVVVGLGKIRSQGDRLPIPCHGLIELALLLEDVAQVVVCLEEWA